MVELELDSSIPVDELVGRVPFCKYTCYIHLIIQSFKSEFEFNGPVNTGKVMLRWSVFPEQIYSSKWLTSTL